MYYFSSFICHILQDHLKSKRKPCWTIIETLIHTSLYIIWKKFQPKTLVFIKIHSHAIFYIDI